MIYFVDEDLGPMTPYMAALEMQGYAVEAFEFADQAYDHLTRADPADVELVVFDIMIAVLNPDELFNEGTTAGYDETGLKLIDALIDQRPDLFPERAVVFSAIYQGSAVARATALQNESGIPFLRKREFPTGAALASRLIQHIQGGNEQF